MTSIEAIEKMQDYLTGGQIHKIQDYLNIIKKDLERLEKLEEAIEILKDKFYLRVHSNMFGSWLFIKEKTKHGEDVSCELDLDIVDTIKEVFENE